MGIIVVHRERFGRAARDRERVLRVLRNDSGLNWVGTRY